LAENTADYLNQENLRCVQFKSLNHRRRVSDSICSGAGQYNESFQSGNFSSGADSDHRLFTCRMGEEGDEDLLDYLSEDFQGELTVAGHQRYEEEIDGYAKVLDEEYDVDIDTELVDPYRERS
jgi:hypothetical protein